jgi:hypothetical protein
MLGRHRLHDLLAAAGGRRGNEQERGQAERQGEH